MGTSAHVTQKKMITPTLGLSHRRRQEKLTSLAMMLILRGLEQTALSVPAQCVKLGLALQPAQTVATNVLSAPTRGSVTARLASASASTTTKVMHASAQCAPTTALAVVSA